MQKKILIVVSLSILAVLCWFCLQFAIILGFKVLNRAIKSTDRVVFVTSSNLESEPGVRVLDANNPTFKVLSMEPNRVDVKWENTRIEMKEASCRLKKLDGPLVQVMARLNNKQYPMFIDSGCGVDLVVNDVVVRDNQLGIFPFKSPDWTFSGFCHVDKIEIGDMTITTPPCLYTLNHFEKRVLGRTKWKQRQVLLGLGLLRRFRYFLIDNVSSEVEFGMQDSFQADSIEMWKYYDMSIERTVKNDKKIIIHIPIAGEMTKARFDTGTSWSLAMTEKIWDKYSAKLQVLKESRERARFFYGWKDVKKITVSEFSIGDKSMTDASIFILDDSVFKESFILIGMGYFKDTIVVIDFERSLLWVRKPQSL